MYAPLGASIVYIDPTTKKTVLLRRAKTAAKAQKIATKAPFGLLWWFHPPTMHCHNSSIAKVAKNVAIDTPFSGVCGLLRWTKNRCHMLSEFVSIDFYRWVMPATIVATCSGNH